MAGGFRHSRIAGELITGRRSWYGAVVAAHAPPPDSGLRRALVLGSASPRRREILERLGIEHVVVAPCADEAVLPGEAVDRYLERVVGLKLEAVRRALKPDQAARSPLILVADTSVVLGADILGKPGDAQEALTMITRLSGRTHEVHTRFAVGDPERVFCAETVVTQVTFRPLEQDEIAAYPATGEGTDKAGGYAVQGRASGFVARIDGSHTNVIGLPACEVVMALRRVWATAAS
jgi:septum formation protein